MRPDDQKARARSSRLRCGRSIGRVRRPDTPLPNRIRRHRQNTGAESRSRRPSRHAVRFPLAATDQIEELRASGVAQNRHRTQPHERSSCQGDWSQGRSCGEWILVFCEKPFRCPSGSSPRRYLMESPEHLQLPRVINGLPSASTSYDHGFVFKFNPETQAIACDGKISERASTNAEQASLTTTAREGVVSASELEGAGIRVRIKCWRGHSCQAFSKSPPCPSVPSVVASPSPISNPSKLSSFARSPFGTVHWSSHRCAARQICMACA